MIVALLLSVVTFFFLLIFRWLMTDVSVSLRFHFLPVDRCDDAPFAPFAVMRPPPPGRWRVLPPASTRLRPMCKKTGVRTKHQGARERGGGRERRREREREERRMSDGVDYSSSCSSQEDQRHILPHLENPGVSTGSKPKHMC